MAPIDSLIMIPDTATYSKNAQSSDVERDVRVSASHYVLRAVSRSVFAAVQGSSFACLFVRQLTFLVPTVLAERERGVRQQRGMPNGAKRFRSTSRKVLSGFGLGLFRMDV